MTLLKSGWVLAAIAAVVNIGTTGGLIFLQREMIFIAPARPDPDAGKPRFWSFRADEVEALITELKGERAKLVLRQTELDKVAAHIDTEKQELEKTRQDVGAMRDAITAEVPEIQESERKNLKTLAQTYAAMSPASVVTIFHEMDDTMCVKVLSLMKPDKVGGILQEMALQDKDGTTTKRAARISDKLRLMKAPPKPQP
jgi:flagellar motility protein MotE (MotC chaperone)